MAAPRPDDSVLEEAIERWRAGDRHGFAVVYGSCFPLVREIVHIRLDRRLRVTVDSVDIVHDAFLNLLRSPPPEGVRTGPDLTAYLATAVINRVRQVHRGLTSDKRDIRREQSADEGGGRPDWLPGTQPTPSQVSMGRETYARYLAALEALPEREREAVVLARHVGLSAEAGARALELQTPGAFRALLSRALARVSLGMQGRGDLPERADHAVR